MSRAKTDKSPTKRTLEFLRALNFQVAVVEYWDLHSRRTMDLLGVIDIIAVGGGIIGVQGYQACSDADLSTRVKKCKAEPRLRAWLESKNTMIVIGWRKRKLDTEWNARLVEITLEDLTSTETTDESGPPQTKARRRRTGA